MKNLSFVMINGRVTRFYDHLDGEMAEWSNAPVLKDNRVTPKPLICKTLDSKTS